MKIKAVFLDRDKTILLPYGGEKYIYRIEDCYIPATYIRALKLLNDEGFQLFIITNQGRIAKGYTTEEDVVSLHKSLDVIFQYNEIHITHYEYCPHNPRGTVYPYNITCECRKPNTGMLDSIFDTYEIDIERSWMVGDSGVDMAAGKRSGLNTVKVLTGIESSTDYADYVEKDLSEAVNRILSLSI